MNMLSVLGLSIREAQKDQERSEYTSYGEDKDDGSIRFGDFL